MIDGGTLHDTTQTANSPDDCASAAAAHSPAVPLMPVRGLVPLHNRAGWPYSLLDLRRWLRLSRLVHKTLKVDLLAHGVVPAVPRELFELAASLDLRLSLRTDCSAPPPDLASWREAYLLDVHLAPARIAASHFDAWLDACRSANLDIRVQVLVSDLAAIDPEVLADRMHKSGVVAVNISARDEFLPIPAVQGADRAGCLANTNALVRALDTRGIEASILWLPFCQADPENRPHVLDERQFFADHQQYRRNSYELARLLYRRRPVIAGKAILMLLGRHTFGPDRIDDRLLPWMLETPWFNARLAAWRRLTRHLRFFRRVPKAIDSAESAEREIAQRAEAETRALGPVCSQCSVRHICDRDAPWVRHSLPDVELHAQPGETVTSPMHFAAGRRRYYDAIDRERLATPAAQLALAEQATRFTMNRAPDRVVAITDYGVDGTYFLRMEGGIRWYSYTNTEKRSTSLGRFTPPFTLSYTVAGGMADYVGFSVARNVRLVCPMETHRHEITLHVGADGRYVLLRDAQPVRPVEFEDEFHLPLRVGDVVEPRIVIWNIDGAIVTQSVRVWEGGDAPKPAVAPKYSIVIACTRYTRRLQAVLRNLAHQEGFDLRRLELIIGYVPGLDATDDLIDSLQAAFPDLRIVRSPFPPEKATSKGYLINESAAMASGEWLVFMDADILLPPNFFATVEREGADSHFLFPDGRKMLSAETTAKVLLGEIEPWRQWQELMESPGEHRRNEAQGVPIGFLQAVKAECFQEVKYIEVEHFEWADAKFGKDIRERFGPETRLSLPVAHLDHGGSRWYGTQQHF